MYVDQFWSLLPAQVSDSGPQYPQAGVLVTWQSAVVFHSAASRAEASHLCVRACMRACACCMLENSLMVHNDNHAAKCVK